MEFNIKKYKIIIFQKHQSKILNLHFHIGKKDLNILQDVHLHKCTLAQQQLSEKALRALFKIHKNLDFHKLLAKEAIKIFD